MRPVPVQDVAAHPGGEALELSVVVPARNEAENVASLVRGLREGLAGVEFRIVFVDDSTDGTPGVIRGLAEEDRRVMLVHREGAEREGGLSTAVTTGMELFSWESEFTCVMDADGQHPPEKVREMLEVAQAGMPTWGCRAATPGRQLRGALGVDAAGGLFGSAILCQGRLQGGRKTTDPMTGFFWCATRPSPAYSSAHGFNAARDPRLRPELRVAEVPFGSGRATPGSPRPA